MCNHESNICYELNHAHKTQSEADTSCRNRSGGHLATILDSNTQRYIQQMVRREHDHYWIGGRLNIMEQWTWVDGTPYTGQQTLCH